MVKVKVKANAVTSFRMAAAESDRSAGDQRPVGNHPPRLKTILPFRSVVNEEGDVD
jgi:hypothetical protein